MTPTISVRHVSKRYGRLRALDDVSLTIPVGVTGLLGPNGAGKTTLARTLATVLPPDEGTIVTFGSAVRSHADRVAVRRRLGYMPQELGFHRRFTVFEFVDYLAILKELLDRRHRHDEVRRVIAAVGLEAKVSARIKTLSGGMRQRVALAQSLLGDPDLLLLDEPTAGLDPEQRMRLRGLVSRIGQDRTVLISTHQTEDVAALCQQVVVMHGGRIRFTGTPGQLADQARGAVWISDAPQPDAWASWRTPDGRFRQVGTPPNGAQLVGPTVEEGYLTLLRNAPVATAA